MVIIIKNTCCAKKGLEFYHNKESFWQVHSIYVLDASRFNIII